MAQRELYVRFANGTGRVVAQERDDDQGRRILDRTAWQFMARADVVSAEVSGPKTRTAGYRR